MTAIHLLERRDRAGLKARVAGASPDTAYGAVMELAFAAPLDAPLDGLVEGPQDVHGLALAGGLRRYRAWRLRGGGLVEATPDRRLTRYAEELRAAVELLEAALARDPRHGLAAAFLASAAVEGDAEDRRRVEATLIEARDVPAVAWVRLLQASTAKWGGSHAEMWAFVGRHRDRSRPGTLALVAVAHFEQQLSLRWFDDSPGAGFRAGGYFRRKDVVDDLARASDEALAAAADADPAALRLVDGWTARVLTEAGDPARAGRHLRRLGPHADPTVWGAGLAFVTPRLRLATARLRAGVW